VSKATNSFEIYISVTGADDALHSMHSSIAADLVADPAARAEITSYLIDRSKRVIVKKIEETK
jgi:hypothetical protein